MNRNIVKLLLATLTGLSLLFTSTAFADAGQAIFVYGNAYVMSSDGDRRGLKRGDAVESGDTILTSSNGRVQIQMADGGLLALRPGSEFLIEKFQMANEQADDVFAAEAIQPSSFFVLIKGGFRSITGAIGQENKANYRVKTPVATIGIRGTDYDVVYCASDCQTYSRIVGRTLKNGLYVGVNSGGVNVATEAGSIDLSQGEFGFAANARVIPKASADAADLLSRTASSVAVDKETPENNPVATEAGGGQPDTGLTAQDPAGNQTNFVQGGDSAAQSSAATGAVAFTPYAGSNQSGVAAADQAAQIRDANDNVIGFSDQAAMLQLEQSSPVNVGRDEDRSNATGLSWGRWESGNLSVTDVNGVQTTVISDSVHVVAAAADSVSPVVPITGNANFAMVGNTDPTDNRGNVGALGSANLSADFLAQTVDADVSLSFQETSQVWTASATDVGINSSDATFAGDFDSVTVLGPDGTSSGDGDLAGFFIGDDGGVVNGAGLSYSLTEGTTEVNGAAAFQRND